MIATKYAEADGLLVVERVQDCTAILEDATRRRLEGIHGDKEMRHAASIPRVIVEKYMNDRGIDFAEFLRDPVHAKALLQDPALAGFRVWEGRV
jgi:hypothetical protein